MARRRTCSAFAIITDCAYDQGLAVAGQGSRSAGNITSGLTINIPSPGKAVML